MSRVRAATGTGAATGTDQRWSLASWWSLQGRWWCWGPPTLLATAVFVVYAGYAVSRFDTYLTAGYDLGIFDQAVRGYSRFRAPIVPLRGPDLNIWADHTHPIIAVAAPLYWIWDSPVTLLVLQAALVAASVPFVHAFARRRLGPVSALTVSAVYAVGWPLQGLVDFDFHEVAFAIPLLAAAIDALDRGRDRPLLICSLLLLAVREDLGVVVAVLGLLRILRDGLPGPRASWRGRPWWGRPWRGPSWRGPSWRGTVRRAAVRRAETRDGPPVRRRVGAVLVVAGIAAYLLLTSVVIPSFAPNGHFAYWTFDSLGPDLPGALAFVVTHPLRTFGLLFTPTIKAQTWLYLLVPLAFLSLRSRYTLVALPLLAERFLNSRENLWSTHFHYNALPWLVLTLAMLDGGARLGVWSRPVLRRAALVVMVLVPVWLATQDTTTPQALRRMADGSAWASGSQLQLQAQRAAVAQVPAGVCVSVDDRLAPHLTHRNRVTLPGIGAARTDYVVLDLGQREVGSTLEGPLEAPVAARDRLRGEGYVEVFRQENLLVLRSPTYAGSTPGCAS